jgi:hypothetical protein
MRFKFLGDLLRALWDRKLKTQSDLRMLALEDGTTRTRKRRGNIRAYSK